MGRESTFSHPEVIQLLSTQFVPFADDCHPYQVRQDEVGAFFRHISEQGHYAGREKPTNTRQGHYAFTHDGRFLGSVNTTDPAILLETLHRALERLAAGETGPPFGNDGRLEDRAGRRRAAYPEGGLVLKMFVRDLPRGGHAPVDGRYARNWNMDYVWLTADEVAALVPSRPEVGEVIRLPDWFARRLARFHFVDRVRGESPHWPADAVQEARFELRATEIDGDRAHFEFTGNVRCEQSGVWSIRGFHGQPEAHRRGIEATVYGKLIWERQKRRVIEFDAAATGMRFGATTYNVRYDDTEPAPIGLWWEVAGDAAVERTPPAAAWAGYFAHE